MSVRGPGRVKTPKGRHGGKSCFYRRRSFRAVLPCLRGHCCWPRRPFYVFFTPPQRFDTWGNSGTEPHLGTGNQPSRKRRGPPHGATLRDRHLGIRPVSLLDIQPVVSPVNGSSWPLHHSGAGRWLGPTPWKTFTSYPLPAFLAHTALGPACSGQCSVYVLSTCANSAHQPLMLDYGCRREACERRQGCQIFTA
jgi:hypothetical protein